jgi:hypothetical protein
MPGGSPAADTAADAAAICSGVKFIDMPGGSPGALERGAPLPPPPGGNIVADYFETEYVLYSFILGNSYFYFGEYL